MTRLNDDDHRVEQSADIYTVTEISDAIRQHLESEFHDVSVLGEIANFKTHTSGHLYFSLRDGGNALRAVIFKRNAARIGFEPENGQLVVAKGGISHYGGSGQTQLIARTLLPAGRGMMEIEYRRLLQELIDEGLTAAARKRPIPVYPARIALVTSATGAVIRDMTETIGRRWPLAKLLHLCVDVQGPRAEISIVRAFEMTNGLEDVDLVILARGGGSVEDLWTFNRETVARAVAGSRHPVITGIGHEIDTTICDHVSDLRATTPAAAAEMATPDSSETRGRIDSLIRRLSTLYRRGAERRLGMLEFMMLSSSFPAIEHGLERAELRFADAISRLDDLIADATISARSELDRLLLRLGASTEDLARLLDGLLANASRRLTGVDPRAGILVERGSLERISSIIGVRTVTGIEMKRRAVSELSRMLDGLNPVTVLRRGYTYCTGPEEEGIITRTGDIAPGDEMMVHFYDGGAFCTVDRTRKGRSWRRKRDSKKL